MDISKVTGNNFNSNVSKTKTEKTSADAATAEISKEAEKTESAIVKAEDTFVKEEKSVSSETGIYTKESIQKSVGEMEEQRKQALTNMVNEMLGQQAKASGMKYIGLSVDEIREVATDEEIQEAEESVSDGGYWSVDAVATRIMDMAEIMANGNASTLATLKDAVIKGFGAAVDAFGYSSMDQMPEITSKTYDEVMKRFDDLENKLNGAAEAE